MKVLILSISTGQGHHSTAEAIEKQFVKMGVECKIVDAYGYIEPRLQTMVSKAYTLATYTKRFSSLAYGLSAKKTWVMSKYSVPKVTNSILAHELRKCIDEEKADVVISTHIFAATMVNILLEKKRLNAITVGIITDFTIHPFWEETRLLDYFVTPSELLEYQMNVKGIDTKKNLPFGIPIKEKFNNRISKQEAREILGLDPDKLTILLMSGSMGYGKIDRSIEDLDELPFDFQAIVVCGNNKRQYKKIKSLPKQKRFDVYGYVDNVDIMMEAADCIISKPGGITTSEALAKELPMLMLNPIPGHEERNSEFLLNNGLGLLVTKTFPLDEAIYYINKNPDRLKNLRKCIKDFKKEKPTEKLCEFLVDQVSKRAVSKSKKPTRIK
jgi:processive 1,2-diacylglycerol beta-glucosyltransferase